MKLLYGTGNPAKLEAMRRRLAPLGIELFGLRDLPREIPGIDNLEERMPQIDKR